MTAMTLPGPIDSPDGVVALRCTLAFDVLA
jgi:hypothetical protein